MTVSGDGADISLLLCGIGLPESVVRSVALGLAQSVDAAACRLRISSGNIAPVASAPSPQLNRETSLECTCTATHNLLFLRYILTSLSR